jgi:tetratricopeptide (TPR) repeat protein
MTEMQSIRDNDEGHYAEALSRFLQAADEWPATDPDRFLPVVSAANMHFKLEQLEEARALYERILSETKEDRDLIAQKRMRRFENMANFKLNLIRNGKPYQAAADDDEAKAEIEQSDAALVEALYQEGLELNRQGDTEGALKMFLEAKKISPKGKVLLSAGNMYLKLGNLRLAEDLYMRVRKEQDNKFNYVYSEKHRKIAWEKMQIVWERKKAK